MSSSWLPGWLVGSGAQKAAAPPAPDDSLESMDKLVGALSTLQLKRAERAAGIEQQQDLLRAQAKCAHDQGKREQAAQLLKRAATLALPLRQMDAQIANLETTVSMMETTAISAQTAVAMRQGATSMRTMIKTVTLDDIETVHDDLSEVLQDTSDLNQALARPLDIGGGSGIDEDAYDDEVAAQMQSWNNQRAEQNFDTLPLPPAHVIDPAALAPVRSEALFNSFPSK